MKHHYRFLMALGIGVLAGTGAGLAESPESPEITHLSIIGTNGEINQFEISGIDKITFDEAGDNLIIDGRNFAIDGIESMRFDLEVQIPDPGEDTGVDTVVGDLQFTLVGKVATISPAPGEPLEVSVYDLGGIRLYHSKSDGAQSIDFSGYPRGTFIIKANNKVIKIQN